MWFLGLLLLLAAAGLALGARSQRRRLGNVVSTETCTVEHLRELAASMAKDFGPGELRFPAGVTGTAVCTEPVVSDLAEVPSVHYSMSVHREYEVTEESNEGDERARRSEQVARKERSVPFDLEDATGAIRIEPSGARFIAEEVLSRQEPATGEMVRVGRFTLDLPAEVGDSRSLGYRFEERAIPAGSEVYVIGEVRDPDGELRIGCPEDGGELLVSVKGRSRLIRELGSGAHKLKIAAIVLGASGALLVLADLL